MFDRRNWKKPLLALKHGRTFDRTLATECIPINQSMSPVRPSSKAISYSAPANFTVLSSHKNRLVTLYDVSRDTQELVHVHNSFSCVTAGVGEHIGQMLPPSQSAFWSVITLDPTGVLHVTKVDMASAETVDASRDAVPVIIEDPPAWPTALLSKQDSVFADFSGLYKRVCFKLGFHLAHHRSCSSLSANSRPHRCRSGRIRPRWIEHILAKSRTH